MEEYRRVGATLYEYLTPRVKQWNGKVKDTRRPLCLVAARERDKSFSWRLQRNAAQLGKLLLTGWYIIISRPLHSSAGMMVVRPHLQNHSLKLQC